MCVFFTYLLTDSDTVVRFHVGLTFTLKLIEELLFLVAMETICLCASPQGNPPWRRCSSDSTTRAAERSCWTVRTSGRWTPHGSGVT